MKKQLLAISMVATAGLFAETDAPMSNQSQQQNCCTVCCCNPCCCCVPKPKKCIDCECYTPAFYDLQCDWGLSLDAEFLYWYAKETNLSYASKIRAVNVDTVGSANKTVFGDQSYQHIDAAWDPGFRIGIGFNSDCDGWDYNLTWTWLRNSRKETACVPNYTYDVEFGTAPTQVLDPFLANDGQCLLLNPWINASFHALSTPFFSLNNLTPTVLTFDQVAAKYKLRFNQIDFDIGRKYWLSACFNLRPYAGLRGYWTKARFKTVSSRSFTFNDSPRTFTLKDQFKTDAWGVGIIAGFEPAWYFSRCFALYAKAGTAAVWGDFEVKKREKYFWDVPLAVPAPGPLPVAASNGDAVGSSCGPCDPCSPCDPPNYEGCGFSKFSQMTGMLDLALGLRWETTWCCDRYMTALDLGWEHHILFDQNHRWKTSDFFDVLTQGTSDPEAWGYRQYDEATGNLGLGGFVLRLNFDF